jgi:hypothetical protein
MHQYTYEVAGVTVDVTEVTKYEVQSEARAT